ncbi:MAG: hypothetical protein QXF56_03575 [Candidatus Micrarchaeia archaeon]
MRKAQATMREIGLAALIMIILILYLYFTSPQLPEPTQFKEKCSLSGNFTCRYVFLRRGSSRLELILEQNTGSVINITSFVCTKRTQIPLMPALNNSIVITSGERAYVAGGNSGNEIVCTERDGSIPEGKLGDVYEGYIYMTYIDRNKNVVFVNGSIITKYS